MLYSYVCPGTTCCTLWAQYSEEWNNDGTEVWPCPPVSLEGKGVCAALWQEVIKAVGRLEVIKAVGRLEVIKAVGRLEVIKAVGRLEVIKAVCRLEVITVVLQTGGD